MVSKFSNKRSQLILAMVIGAGLLFLASGCSTLQTLGEHADSLPVEGATPSRGIYQVEMSGNFAKQTTFRGEIDGPITVQTALERSGAVDKFRSMDVTILRVVKETGRALKMSVEYVRSDKSVHPKDNYSIHPNDRIIVDANSSNGLDKLIESLNY